MSYLPEPKDPGETITVAFDYSNLGGTPTNPVVTIALRWGADSQITLAPDGLPTVNGNRVLQRISGGADLNDYNLKCLADTPGGDRLAVDVVLAVRTRPV